MKGRSAIFFDGPAGSQVPQVVIDAIGDYLACRNANRGGVFATAGESDLALNEAHAVLADFLGASDPDCVSFGANMTTLTLSLSRALAGTWEAGDEILVTDLDHDGNFTPWKLAARDAGAKVRKVNLHAEDCTLDLDDLRAKLSERTRLIAFCAASNLSGSVTPTAEICRLAREVGALTFVDAVHYAPHRVIDVEAWGCDFLACSAYKFFGPHVGVMWGRRELLETFSPYKLRPAPDSLPGRWMTGTQNHEGIVGARAAVDYLASLSGEGDSRRNSLCMALAAIEAYENELSKLFLKGFAQLDDYELFGIGDPARVDERVPTFSFRHKDVPPREVAERLGQAGIFTWHGNFYAQPVTEALGLEPEGLVRAGFLHYSTREEVERLLEKMSRLV